MLMFWTFCWLIEALQDELIDGFIDDINEFMDASWMIVGLLMGFIDEIWSDFRGSNFAPSGFSHGGSPGLDEAMYYFEAHTRSVAV